MQPQSEDTEVRLLAADYRGASITTTTLDAAFSLLADAPRRAVIKHVHESPTTTVSALATALATRLGGSHDRWSLSLRHASLPKLASHRAVEYDAESGTVRRGPMFETYVRILDETGRGER